MWTGLDGGDCEAEGKELFCQLDDVPGMLPGDGILGA
jgi:hypothetical protein